MSKVSMAFIPRLFLAVLCSLAAPGNFSAQLVRTQASPGQQFSLAFGTVVTNGVPGPGAGVLSEALEQDHYTFTATAGETLFFHDRGADPNIDWALFDSNNQQIFRDRLDGFFSGRVTFQNSGTYEVRVFSAGDGTATGRYSFEVHDPQDQVFNLALGLIVTNNVPGAGAGRLDIPGQIDSYRFSATAGQTLFFHD
ncbi:MAG TPA: hypothetical protein VGR78_01230, partial [Verrucomicrobiae bacterium]|nr:hypothetical protein [Verrucomicrobiae bacterium]